MAGHRSVFDNFDSNNQYCYGWSGRDIKKAILILALVLILPLGVWAYQISWQGVVLYQNGSNILNGSVRINITEQATGVNIINLNSTIEVLPTNQSGFDIIINSESLVRDMNYSACFYTYAGDVGEEFMGCEDFLPSAGKITAFSTYYNKTVNLYSGNLSFTGGLLGYRAGDSICNSEFAKTHFCTQEEVMYTIGFANLSTLADWSGEAWTSTGSAKYSPASLPVNDCNGWKHGTAGSYLGNWWKFNISTGGEGKAGHCLNALPLACCS